MMPHLLLVTLFLKLKSQPSYIILLYLMQENTNLVRLSSRYCCNVVTPLDLTWQRNCITMHDRRRLIVLTSMLKTYNPRLIVFNA